MRRGRGVEVVVVVKVLGRVLEAAAAAVAVAEEMRKWQKRRAAVVVEHQQQLQWLGCWRRFYPAVCNSRSIRRLDSYLVLRNPQLAFNRSHRAAQDSAFSGTISTRGSII